MSFRPGTQLFGRTEEVPMIVLRSSRRFALGAVARSVAVLAGGTALAQLIVVVTSPLLTRLYTPADFGVLSVYVSLLTFLLGISSLRYHLAIPLVSNTNALASLLVFSCLVVCGFVLVVLVGIVFLSEEITRWTNAPGLKPFLWFLPIGLAGASVIQVLTAWAVRSDRFSTLARVRIRQSASQVAVQIGLSFLSPAGLGLIVGDAVGRAAGGLSLARLALNDIRDELPHVTTRSMVQIAHQFRRFPLISTWTGIIASTGAQIPTIMVSAFYGAHVVGWFGLCQRLLSMSFVLVASSIGTVFLSESAKVRLNNPDQLMSLFRATVKRSCVLALLLVAGVVIFAPIVIGPLLGNNWAEAGRYAQILAIASGFQFVNRAVSSASTVLERQDLDLIAEIAWTIAATCSLLVARWLEVTPFNAVVIYSVAISVGSLICLGLSWYAITDAIKASARKAA